MVPVSVIHLHSLLQHENDPAMTAEMSGQETALPAQSDRPQRAGEPCQGHPRHGNKPGSDPVPIVRFNTSVVTEALIEGRHHHFLGFIWCRGYESIRHRQLLPMTRRFS
jgi:hypothetical protein